MALEPSNQPTVALLGGGYTLQKVAALLPKGSFVITSREAARCEQWRDRGWLSESVSYSDREGIARFFAKYPSIEVVVDSDPPLRSEDPSSGTQAVADAIVHTAVRRIIYLSTTGVFGVRDGTDVNEETPPAPWNPQAAARLACEDVYRACAHQCPTLNAVALRLPAIYGADRGIAISLREGTYRIIDSGEQWTNRIHVEDLAEIIGACIRHAGELPRVLCVSDDYPARAREVVSYICEREGLPFPRSITAEEALQRSSYTMLSNQRVSNARVKEVLGIVLRYPSFKEGIYSSESGRD